MKKIIILAVILSMVLAGCARNEGTDVEISDYNCFDTITTLKVYAAPSEQAVREIYDNVFARLNDVFDIYAPHEGINGAYALNEAGGEWVKIEPELMELLQKCIEWREISDKVNITLGLALAEWKDFLNGGELPDPIELAALPGGWDKLEIDGDMARITGGAKVDLGAVAKGFAAEKLADALREAGMNSFIISAGCNVVCGEREKPFVVGVTDPLSGGMRCTLSLTNMSAVSSGDYQRFRDYEGVRYHHIIDPDTLCPGGEFAQVSIICESSALADFLSTAIFLSDYETGMEIARKTGAEVIWIDHEGNMKTTDGIQKYMN